MIRIFHLAIVVLLFSAAVNPASAGSALMRYRPQVGGAMTERGTSSIDCFSCKSQASVLYNQCAKRHPRQRYACYKKYLGSDGTGRDSKWQSNCFKTCKHHY
jgi:hypothetical protein